MTGMQAIIGALFGRRPLPLQAGALCFRDGRVLLISSLETGRWVIPKGWPMAGRSLAGAALQEAWEEAGVTGRLRPGVIGHFVYEKKRRSGLKQRTEVQVFAIDVTRLQDDYPEVGQRQREWFAPRDAARLVDEPGLQMLLAALPDPDGAAA